MWGIRNEDILNYKSLCYISNKLEPIKDTMGNEITTYSKPKSYMLNIQPISGSSEIAAFGELISRMKVAIVGKKDFDDSIKEYDLAYLDGVEPKDEKIYGSNANYRVYSVQSQNAIVKIYFLKIIKGE